MDTCCHPVVFGSVAQVAGRTGTPSDPRPPGRVCVALAARSPPTAHKCRDPRAGRVLVLARPHRLQRGSRCLRLCGGRRRSSCVPEKQEPAHASASRQPSRISRRGDRKWSFPKGSGHELTVWFVGLSPASGSALPGPTLLGVLSLCLCLSSPHSLSRSSKNQLFFFSTSHLKTDARIR